MKLNKQYTVIYIKRRDGKILFMERNKKKLDPNFGKFIGIGGKIEKNENPNTCIEREVYEETGLILKSFTLCGVVRYLNIESRIFDRMFVYFSNNYKGELSSCNEGTLHWLTFNEFLNKPHWEGDCVFLKDAVNGNGFGNIDFIYSKNSELTSVEKSNFSDDQGLIF